MAQQDGDPPAPKGVHLGRFYARGGGPIEAPKRKRRSVRAADPTEDEREGAAAALDAHQGVVGDAPAPIRITTPKSGAKMSLQRPTQRHPAAAEWRNRAAGRWARPLAMSRRRGGLWIGRGGPRGPADWRFGRIRARAKMGGGGGPVNFKRDSTVAL